MQSQVLEPFKSDEARGPVNGQQPQPVQTMLLTFAQSPQKRDTPPPGNYRSLTRRVGEALSGAITVTRSAATPDGQGNTMAYVTC